MSLENQLALVKADWNNIKWIKNSAIQTQISAIKENHLAFKLIKDPSEIAINVLIQATSKGISYLDNPTEEQQLLAVQAHPNALYHIKNPYQSVILEALRLDGTMIIAVQNQTMEMKEIAIRSDPEAIRWIKNATDPLISKALNKKPSLFHYIEYPSRDIIILALRLRGMNLEYVQSKSVEFIDIALKSNGKAIQFVSSPTESQLFQAYRTTPSLIEYPYMCKHTLSERIQLMILAVDDKYIEQMENPIKLTILTAIMSNPKYYERFKSILSIEDLHYLVQKNKLLIHLLDNTSLYLQLESFDLGHQFVNEDYDFQFIYKKY